MKNAFFVAVLFCVVFSSCTNSVKNDGWVSLFNGKDLTGWKQLGGRNGNARYEVMDSAIVGTTVVNTPNSFLVTEKTYSDFILELDLFMEEPMNSGIQFRSLSKEEYNEGRVHGYQCEVDPSGRAWSGGIYDEARRGWLYPMTLNPEGGKSFKLNDWNHYRIECIGNTIRTWLNGVPAAYLIDNMTPEGFIALQIHSVNEGKEGRHIKWKNIRIKTENLEPSPVTKSVFIMNNVFGNLSEEEMKDGWQWLWNGKTTTGWKGISSDQFPSDRWKINDGILMLAAWTDQQKADLVSAKKYGAFELQWRFMLSKGASGGVQYLADIDKTKKELKYQLQDDENTSDTTAVNSLASLYGLIKPVQKGKSIKPVDGWNHARIVVRPDKQIEHWLNGAKVLEYNVNDGDFKGTAEKGHIVLKDKGKEMSFRDIKIKILN